jgi:hypothetical protein
MDHMKLNVSQTGWVGGCELDLTGWNKDQLQALVHTS